MKKYFFVVSLVAIIVPAMAKDETNMGMELASDLATESTLEYRKQGFSVSNVVDSHKTLQAAIEENMPEDYSQATSSETDENILSGLEKTALD